MAKRKFITVLIMGLFVLASGIYLAYDQLIKERINGDNSKDQPVVVVSEPFPEDTNGDNEGGIKVYIIRSYRPLDNISFEVATSFPVVEDPVYILKVIHPNVTIDWVAELGRKLGIIDGEFIEAWSSIVWRDKTKSERYPEEIEHRQFVSVSAYNDRLLYRHVDRYHIEGAQLPTCDGAEQIARDFLGELGLLPTDAEVQVELYDYEGKVRHLVASFHFKIDGLPVTGMGPSYTVHIGDKGEVVAFWWLYRETEPYEQAIVMAPQDAYHDLINGRGAYHVPDSCKMVIVEQIQLAYWMHTQDFRQDYVVPIYEFKGKCLDQDGEELGEFLGWAEAVKGTVVFFVPTC